LSLSFLELETIPSDSSCIPVGTYDGIIEEETFEVFRCNIISFGLWLPPPLGDIQLQKQSFGDSVKMFNSSFALWYFHDIPKYSLYFIIKNKIRYSGRSK